MVGDVAVLRLYVESLLLAPCHDANLRFLKPR
jgi:hypothetical protein